MIIHLIRHTTPEIEPGICYGQTDLPLASTFETESDCVLKKLRHHYDAIYSSPLLRCIKLSEKLNTDHRITDKRLLEYNFGDWELMPWHNFTSTEAKSWMKNFEHQSTPNGECMLSMQVRVHDLWSELLASSYSSIAIVTHAGVLRLIHGLILATPLNKIFRLQLNFGAVLEVNSDQKSDLITIKHL